MDRHWTFDLVALAGIVAGFALLAAGETLLAGVVAAGCAYALLLPGLVGDSPRRAGHATR